MAKLPLHRSQVAGFLDQVLAHGMAGVMRGWPSTSASWQASFQTVLITFGLSRPLPVNRPVTVTNLAFAPLDFFQLILEGF